MGRLLVLFFIMPWWAYVPASIGVLWLGERVYEQALATEAEKATALEMPVPGAVDLAEFDRGRDIHAADEIHVTGWIDADLNYELVKRRNGIPTDTRYLYMMFGATDPLGAPEVRGALMLTKKEREVFIERIDEFIIGFTDEGEYVFGFNGYGETSTTLGDMAREAIAEQGLRTADNFVFVEPFFEGREAALAPHGVPDQTRLAGWAIAAVVALIGVVKRVRAVTARPSPADLEAAEAEARADTPDPSAFEPLAARSFALPDNVSDDTPLGRLARRNAAPAHTPPDFVPDFAPGSTPEPMAAAVASHAAYETAPSLEPTGQGAAAEPADSRFPPVPEDSPAPAVAPAAGSDLGFYFKLGLAMLVVGGIAYNPSIINVALPFAAVALFWLGVYVVFQKARQGARRKADGATATRRRRSRPEGTAQTVAVGVGGHRIDLTAPVRTARREKGVI